MQGFSFGSYYPGSGVLYRMDPRAKLLLGLLFLITALASRTFCALALVVVFVLVCYTLSHVPAPFAMRSLTPLLGIVALVAVLNLFTQHSGTVLWQLGILRVTEGSVRTAAFMACRLTLMMAGMSIVTLTTTTLDLTAGFERVLAPFARFGLPAHELGMMLGIAFRFMPELAREVAQTRDAQASRGARVAQGPFGAARMLSSIAIPLFTSVFRHAETLSAAMDARCYHGEEGRTRMHPLHFGAIDVAGALASLGLLALVVGVRLSGL